MNYHKMSIAVCISTQEIKSPGTPQGPFHLSPPPVIAPPFRIIPSPDFESNRSSLLVLILIMSQQDFPGGRVVFVQSNSILTAKTFWIN